MNDPVEDPLGENPIDCHPEFEVKEEPFDFCDYSVCWASEGLSVVEDDEFSEDNLGGMSESPIDHLVDLDDDDSLLQADGGKNCLTNGEALMEEIEEANLQTMKAHNSMGVKRRMRTPNSNIKVKKMLKMKGKVVRKNNCVVKTEARNEVRSEIDSELEEMERLQCELAKYRENVKFLQRILNEEHGKMIKLKNRLINMRRRHRRRQLKMLKNSVSDAALQNRAEFEMSDEEVRNLVSETHVAPPLTKPSSSAKSMKKKGQNFIVSEYVTSVKQELQPSMEEVKPKKRLKKVVTARKEKSDIKKEVKMEEVANEPVKRVKRKYRRRKLNNLMGEKDAEAQIATSQMLWNILSRIKTEPYVTQEIQVTVSTNPSPDLCFPLPPHSLPNLNQVPQLVKEFMLREDVSKCCASMPNPPREPPGVRYRIHYLSILHKQFVAENGMLCDYGEFIKHVPHNIRRPSSSYWKMCTCYPCVNPDMKVEKLVEMGLLHTSQEELANILHDVGKEKDFMEQLGKLRECSDTICYEAWERNCSGTINYKRRSISEPVSLLIIKLLEEIGLLKAHIQRTFCQLEAAKLARERAMKANDEVAVHVECAPVTIFQQGGSEPGSVATMITVLTAVLWNEGGSHTMVSFSDSKDYTTAAVWAGMEKLLHSIVHAGKKKICIITDSPTNRYKNKSNFFFMSDFAQVFGVCFRWVFLELSHGIGHAYHVRNTFDTLVHEQLVLHPYMPAKKSSDIMQLVKGHSSSVVQTYSSEDITKYKGFLPTKLKVVQGTQKFYEVIVLPQDFWVRDVVTHDAFRKLDF